LISKANGGRGHNFLKNSSSGVEKCDLLIPVHLGIVLLVESTTFVITRTPANTGVLVTEGGLDIQS